MPCLASAKYSGRVPVPSIRLYSKRRIIHVYIDPSVYSVVRGVLPIIVPTPFSGALCVLGDKGFAVSWRAHARTYSYQMPRSDSEGLLERFKALLRVTAIGILRLQLDYIRETWTPPLGLTRFCCLLCQYCRLCSLLFAWLCLVCCSLLIIPLGI